MQDVIEQQQVRAEAIMRTIRPLIGSDCAETRAIAEEVATKAALITEDLQLELDVAS